ncbi:MAG: gliding motility protein GldN [Polaribacter sp.]|nr:gliding motility protein GldN [Polaribacter sp.]MDG1321702.1 gliding motility protein GldN [Polaribacter sp.]
MKLIKFLICCSFVLIFSTNTIHAQMNILNTNKVENIGKKTVSQIKVDSLDTPLPYGYTSNDDVLWSKVVWEVIDLNQKINHPYYYPTDKDTDLTDRLSLFNTLHTAVKSGKLEIYTTPYFKEKKDTITLKSVLYKKCSQKGQSPEEVLPSEITRFQIKGMWYFDKRQGELKYRLLGIAPLVGFDAVQKCINTKLENDFVKRNPNKNYVKPPIKNYTELYWIFYPEARQILHDSKVFNPDNSMSPITFDHLLNSRRFSSVIVREENVYQNRSIEKYIPKNSIFQLLEAEKIKESIRNKEIDMWNY